MTETELRIAAALTALDQNRVDAFAHELREAWRACRDPELAACYELLIRAHAHAPLRGRDRAERDEDWRTRALTDAGDPLALPVLLAAPWSAKRDELELEFERLELLAAWTPDPLLARALAERLRSPAWAEPASAPLRRQTLQLLGAQADPRQQATLDQVCAEPRLAAATRSVARDAQSSMPQIEAAGPRPSLAMREAIARVERRAGPHRVFERRSAELLAAIEANPDADEPRLVYADWLTGHGDPRGEFINLQLERARMLEHEHQQEHARERELADQFGEGWSGPLHAVLGHREFARGFLVAACVELAELDVELSERGEWATLRRLDGHVSEILARRGPLDHLRELYGFVDLDRFVRLRADNRLARVEHYECSLADPQLQLGTPLGLRSLLVRDALDDRLRALAGSPAIAGLEQLGVYYRSAASYAADHRERRSIRHRLELLRELLPAHVHELRLLDDSTSRASRPRGWILTFTRDDLARFSRLRLDWSRPAHARASLDAVAQLLDLLDDSTLAGLDRIELGDIVDPAPGLRDLIRERLRERLSLTGGQVFDPRE